MSILKAALGELIGLFVDDVLLALGVLAVVALAGVLHALIPSAPSVTGVFLLLGCLGTLAASVMRAAGR
jgi:hypothetical protein